MRNWINASLLLLNLAVPAVASAAWEGSFLVGMSGGYLDRDGDINATIIHPAGSPVTQFVTSNAGSFDGGYLWGLLAGYELSNNTWVLGLEANIDWMDKRHKSDDNVFAFTDALNQGWVYAPHYKTNAVVGLTGRAGFQLCSWLIPYLRAGAEFSDNKLRFTAYDPVQNLYAAGDVKRHMTRFVGGAGLEVPLPSFMVGLSARLEYNYHSKGTELKASGVTRPTLTTQWVDTSDASTNSVKASIVWNLPF